jgi:predicted dehydrogenase
VEVVGTDGWLMLPGTGFRREPFTKLILHQGGEEIYLDGAEPTTETFPFVDPYRLEVEHLADVIRGRALLAYTLDDARKNTAVLQAMHVSIAHNRPERIGTSA